MKNLLKTFAALAILALVSNVTMAQVNDETGLGDGVTCEGTGEALNLQDGSGAMMNGQRGGNALNGAGAGAGVMSQIKENGGEFRDAFKATLTEEQLAIIENLELTRDEKREALQASFSGEQQELYNAHMAEVSARQAARGTSALSEGQAASAAKNGWKKGRK